MGVDWGVGVVVVGGEGCGGGGSGCEHTSSPVERGSEPRRVSWPGGKERVSAAAAAAQGRAVPSPHPVKNKQIVSLWSVDGGGEQTTGLMVDRCRGECKVGESQGGKYHTAVRRKKKSKKRQLMISDETKVSPKQF